MDTRLDFPGYLAVVERESARFTEVLAGAQGSEQVPTCPDWNADDLTYHLAEVQDFWSNVIAREAHTDEDAEAIAKPERPTEREALLGLSHTSTAALAGALRATDPAAARWSWSDEQTAGFSYRRQAHEALIHRLDAELTAGAERTPFDSALATDGIDEALKIMYAGCPPWGSVAPRLGRTALIRTTDTGGAWLVTLAQFTGTDPDGKVHNEPDIVVSDAAADSTALATIEGAAEDLDCWLWHRPPIGEITKSGDSEVLRELAEILGQPIN